MPDRRRRTALATVLALGVAAGALAAAAQKVPESSTSATRESHMFHVLLLLADNEAGGTVQGLPKGVQAALADIAGFLPYKSYRQADSAVVRAAPHGRVILKGPNGEDYAASFRFRVDPAAPAGSLLIDEFALTRSSKPAVPQASSKPLGPGVAPQPMDSPLIASFRINVGETVVVGSSRLEGSNRALVVLLTAIS